MIQTLVPLFVGYGVILLGDFIWLWYIVKAFTIREFHELIVVENGSIRLNLAAGLLAWAVIVLLLYVFVIRSQYSHSLPSTLMYGGLFGFLLYAMYDLTNLTFLKNYSFLFTLVDIGWGTFLCAMVALAMYGANKLFSSHKENLLK